MTSEYILGLSPENGNGRGNAAEQGRSNGVAARSATDDIGASGTSTGQVGLLFFLATVFMLFAGFTSAYIVRQATGNDWVPIELPSFLWVSSALVLISSITMEFARRRARAGNAAESKRWLVATEVLGIAFLASQYIAWRQLAAQGLFLPSNPHSSFFYILTGAHGIHLAGGLIALAVAAVRASPGDSRNVSVHRTTLCATYWHFFALLWLMLFVVLFAL